MHGLHGIRGISKLSQVICMRPAYAMEMRPKSLSGDCVVGLFLVYEGSMQPGRVAWLNGADRVLQVPKDEHGL